MAKINSGFVFFNPMTVQYILCCPAGGFSTRGLFGKYILVDELEQATMFIGEHHLEDACCSHLLDQLQQFTKLGITETITREIEE